MPRRPKPWWHSQKQEWYTKHLGKLTPLGVTDQDDESAAWEAFNKLKRSRAPAPIVDEDDPLVEDLILRFLTWLESNRAKSTYDWYRHFLDSFSLHVGQKTVSELRTHDVTEWCESAGTWSPTTRRNAMCAVKRALQWCDDQDLIDKTPIRKLSLPQPTNRETIIPADLWPKILEHATPQFRLLLEFLAETGCRPYEARTLEAKYLNGDTTMAVFPAVESKGKKRARVIYLTAKAARLAKRLAKERPAGPIFRNTRGEPWNRNSIRIAFRAIKGRLAKKKIEVDQPLYAYALRHTYITEALAKGVPLQHVAELAGHDKRTALQVYGHLDQRQQELLEAARKAKGKGTTKTKGKTQRRK